MLLADSGMWCNGVLQLIGYDSLSRGDTVMMVHPTFDSTFLVLAGVDFMDMFSITGKVTVRDF